MKPAALGWPQFTDPRKSGQLPEGPGLPVDSSLWTALVVSAEGPPLFSARLLFLSWGLSPCPPCTMAVR